MPKRIREAFGEKLKMMPNTYAAVIYPADADPQAVIASLQLIIQDLTLRLKCPSVAEAEKNG